MGDNGEFPNNKVSEGKGALVQAVKACGAVRGLNLAQKKVSGSTFRPAITGVAYCWLG